MRVSKRTNRQSLNIRVARELLTRLDSEAVRLGVARSTLIEDIIADWLKAADRG